MESSVRTAWDRENISGESDRWRVRAALRIRIRSEAADPLDWRDWREYPGSVCAGRKPVLFFIDEIDALGGGRQGAISDPGGAGREFNNITMALMSAIDQYRGISGFVLMAATNRLDGLDDAVIR